MDARCAFHQNQPATFTCERCGNFGCELCRSLSRGPRCAACFARAQDVVAPTGPVPLDFNELLRESIARAWAKRGALAVLALLQAIPAVYTTVIIEKAFTGLGPPFEPGALAPDGLTMADLDRLSAALEPYSNSLFVSLLVTVLVGNLVITACTALFATETPSGGIGAIAFRKFLPVVMTNLVVSMVMAAALTACCLPAVPAAGAVALAVPLVVLGGLGPVAAVRTSFRKVLPQLWVVVGVEVLLWSLVFGGGMVSNAITTPLQMGLGAPGMLIGATLSTYLSALLSMPRLALGVILWERLKDPPPPM